MSASDLLPDLDAKLPATPGSWLKKCIDRWSLVAPYDPTVTEAKWEKYYKERAALDWWTEANGRDDHDDQLSLKPEDEPEWKEDFPMPKMDICFVTTDDAWAEGNSVEEHTAELRKAVNQVVAGCPKLKVIRFSVSFPFKFCS